jgi:hypothetical protein
MGVAELRMDDGAVWTTRIVKKYVGGPGASYHSFGIAGRTVGRA